MITRKQAKIIQQNANNFRTGGTPNEMIMARHADDLLRNEAVIIDDN